MVRTNVDIHVHVVDGITYKTEGTNAFLCILGCPTRKERNI